MKKNLLKTNLTIPGYLVRPFTAVLRSRSRRVFSLPAPAFLKGIGLLLLLTVAGI